AAVAGTLRRAAGHLVAAADLFRHHPDPGLARLAEPGTRRALQALVAARGGLRHGRPDDGRQTGPHHRPAPAAGLHEPPDRLGDTLDPVYDPGRNGIVVPGPGPAAADHLLGRAAERGHGHQCRGRELV